MEILFASCEIYFFQKSDEIKLSHLLIYTLLREWTWDILHKTNIIIITPL